MPLSNLYDLPVWETPEYYAGFDPVGDFLIIGRNRDSSIMDNINYEQVFDDLRELSEKLMTEDDEPFAYDFRANHWAVGWVEAMLLRRESPDKLQARAYEILAALANYPCISDEAYSEAQSEAVKEYWERESTLDRIQRCHDAGVSIFAARVDDAYKLPDELYTHLSQDEMFY